MMKKRLVLILSGLSLGLLLTTSVVLSNFDFGVSKAFEEKERILASVEDNILVKTKHFNITNKEFIEYKENLELVHKMNGIPFQLKDDEIIDRLIENEVILEIAKKQDVVVTKDEVEEYALQTKVAVEQSPLPETHEIHAELAKGLNVSLDEYFTHPDTLEKYEELLMIEKAHLQLMEKGELNEQYTMGDMVQELKLKEKSTMHIDLEELQKLEDIK